MIWSLLKLALFVGVIALVVWTIASPHALQKYKLPDGTIATCRWADGYKEACAHLYGCSDGVQRCVQSYEVIP